MKERDLKIFVGSRIREERKKKNMSQKVLGEKIGVKHNTISSYEKGTNAPEQDALFGIARALDIKVDDLFPSTTEDESTNDLERALKMTNNFNVDDVQLLKGLIEKALSMDEIEREKFLESIRFTIDYHNKMNEE